MTLGEIYDTSFTSGKLKMMFGTIADVADKLIDKIQQESAATGQLEVKDILSRFTTDVIATTAFGLETNSLDDKNTKFYEIGLKAFASFSFFKRAFLMTFKDWGRKLHMTTTRKEIGDFYTDVVRGTIKYREENPQVQRHDFMNLLIKLKNSTGPDSLTFNQIVSQSVVFFLAGKTFSKMFSIHMKMNISISGFETSSTTLTYCMYELSLHEDIQKKARKEVQEVLKKHGGELTYESVNEMQYLEQVINGNIYKRNS